MLYRYMYNVLIFGYFLNISAATPENRSLGFPTRFDTNRPVQSQKMVRSLKSGIEGEEKLYYPSGENKGADQLCSYCTVICTFVFPWTKIVVLMTLLISG